jgi:hypothetical protein
MDWMTENLVIFSLEVIDYAFQKWAKESPKIPTPHDIYTLCVKRTDDLNRNEWWSDYDFSRPKQH